ncbi:hypothetical protein N7492_010500 [Penicillium capsulatum]|uniref:Lysine-specific metallo-endopeptidase domain-containing protein n=1 Tax=Penicillium capsulatum TaxID=69766 RepID=A0A9W9HNV8_9EURO|nr:hypothetical protein N7492_010500 [Penicillium capsulatum]KAJ6113002.1 hypothetical protein N7512_008326 [Penicillium capsulatum]
MKLILFLVATLVSYAVAIPPKNALTKRLKVQCPAYGAFIENTRDPIYEYAMGGITMIQVFYSKVKENGFEDLEKSLNVKEEDYDRLAETASKAMKALFDIDGSSSKLEDRVDKITDIYIRARRIKRSSVVVKCNGIWLHDKDDKDKKYSGEAPPNGKQAFWSTLHEDWIFAQPSAKCPDGLQGTLVNVQMASKAEVKKGPKVVMVICPMVLLEDEYKANEPQKFIDSRSATHFDDLLNAISTVVFHEYLHNAGLKDSITKDGNRIYSYKDVVNHVMSNSDEASDDVQNHLFLAVGGKLALEGFEVDWKTGDISPTC